MNFVLASTKAAKYVRGKKTYFAILACGATEAAYAMGYINAPSRDILLQFFGGAGAIAFCAKMNRAIDALKLANNTYKASK